LILKHYQIWKQNKKNFGNFEFFTEIIAFFCLLYNEVNGKGNFNKGEEMKQEYPNISKERAKESINAVILYLRQFKLEPDSINCETKAMEIERFIGKSKEEG